MSVCYELRNYWCASRMVCRLSPRVAVRYLTPRIVWAVTDRERSLLERLRDSVQHRDRSAYGEGDVVPLQRAVPVSVPVSSAQPSQAVLHGVSVQHDAGAGGYVEAIDAGGDLDGERFRPLDHRRG